MPPGRGQVMKNKDITSVPTSLDAKSLGIFVGAMVVFFGSMELAKSIIASGKKQLQPVTKSLAGMLPE